LEKAQAGGLSQARWNSAPTFAIVIDHRSRAGMSTRTAAEQHLPADILQRASLRGGEYAWLIKDVPSVIAAAKRANLVNIGGQLQFRIPDEGTCECYWVNVDTYRSVSKDLP
jgi:hypothetical protein